MSFSCRFLEVSVQVSAVGCCCYLLMRCCYYCCYYHSCYSSLNYYYYLMSHCLTCWKNCCWWNFHYSSTRHLRYSPSNAFLMSVLFHSSTLSLFTNFLHTFHSIVNVHSSRARRTSVKEFKLQQIPLSEPGDTLVVQLDFWHALHTHEIRYGINKKENFFSHFIPSMLTFFLSLISASCHFELACRESCL